MKVNYVYAVWYQEDEQCFLYNLYAKEEDAANKVEELQSKFTVDVWYNHEMVL